MQELFTIHGPLKDALAQFGAIVHASPDGNDINERLQHLNVRGSDATSLYQVCHLQDVELFISSITACRSLLIM
jgi:hypothetical protein